MNLFLDTSALIKLYVDELDSPLVRRAIETSPMCAVSRIAWAEAHAALARRERDHSISSDLLAQACSALEQDWPAFSIVEVSQQVVEKAAEYAIVFGLLAYDSVQLASAAVWTQQSEEPVVFACFDAQLNRAAKVLNLHTLK